MYLSSIDEKIKPTARFTRKEFASLFDAVAATIQPPPPVNYTPIYDLSNLAFEIQKATQEFHERWNGLLGLGRSNTHPKHWTQIKALTRRVGVFGRDEYDDLRPIADLILRLQDQISAFLADMVTLHLEANQQRWPRSWDDLIDDYEACVARSGRPWTFEELSERVIVDWNVDTQFLRGIPPVYDRPPLFRAIWARDGSSAGLGRGEPNSIIAEYLRTHPRISK